MTGAGPTSPFFEWAVASSALDGSASGDLHVVVPGTPLSLLGAIDGLGHGPDARRAAEECLSLLQAHAGAALLDMVHECHAGLRDTRGVALTLAVFDAEASALDWLAIGNVEGLVLHRSGHRQRTREAVIQRGGVVGYRLPALKTSRVALEPGDLILFATDGIRSDFAEHVNAQLPARQLAEDIARRSTKGSDDALVLIVRHRPDEVP
jgi:negative regulator of sigma-B (phosphoserine phosphatase)